ncbi:MAG: diguanylate cyclase [Arenimonas sp.]|nr:diguanylate cyclase [Arenimonas sp.]
MTASAPPPATHVPDSGSASRLRSLPKRAYRFRILGMGLASLPLMAVLRELDAGVLAWSWMALACFAWPHVAYASAARSADPFKAELRNFMVDSALIGSFVPMLHFNLLPSAVLASVAIADKINTGVRWLWLRSLPGMVGALLVGGLLTGFAVAYDTSPLVMMACLPIMVIHTLAVSQSSYQLVRKVQKQNQQLAELTRRDQLTGLASRGHWQLEAASLLERHQAQGRAATLLLLDVDHFKAINDRYGHGVGDDVLRGIAGVMRHTLPLGSHAGRLGGDEFAVALPISLRDAEAIAERLRSTVEAIEIPTHPGLRCSISLGLALPPEAGLALREWMEAADRALYRAKNAGRNQTVSRDPVQPPAP